MIARLQQTISALIVLAIVACTWRALAKGELWTGLAGTATVIAGHSFVLGAEFLFIKFLSQHNGRPDVPSWVELGKAWWAEVLAATRTFCWQQPFRSQTYPDYVPGEAHRRTGVLLIHGFFCNRGFWNRWLDGLRLRAQPVVAVNLEPIFGSIDHYPATIDAAIATLERTGRKPIAIGHSMGGLALRAWLASHPANGTRLKHAITLGSPHHGTAMARLAFSENGRQMRRHSPWLRELSAREAALQQQTPLTCYYSHCDNIVFPPDTATLPTADNRHLPATAHVHMASHPEPWVRLLELLAEADHDLDTRAELSLRP